jgi:hypothetical protein
VSEETETNETETTVAEAVTPAGIAEAVATAVKEGMTEVVEAFKLLLKASDAEGTETTEEASADAAATETAEKAATFSKEEVTEMLAAQKVSLIKDVVEAYGPPTRKGFVSENFDAAAAVTSPTSTKAPHEMNASEYQEWQRNQANSLLPTA